MSHAGCCHIYCTAARRAEVAENEGRSVAVRTRAVSCGAPAVGHTMRVSEGFQQQAYALPPPWTSDSTLRAILRRHFGAEAFKRVDEDLQLFERRLERESGMLSPPARNAADDWLRSYAQACARGARCCCARVRPSTGAARRARAARRPSPHERGLAGSQALSSRGALHGDCLRRAKDLWPCSSRPFFCQGAHLAAPGPSSADSRAQLFLWTPDCGNVGCPLSMTDGCARVLELLGTDDMKRDVLSRLVTSDPDTAWTAGQWMTERPGGHIAPSYQRYWLKSVQAAAM